MKKRMWKKLSAAVLTLTIIGLSLAAVAYRAIGCFDVVDDTAMLAGWMSFSSGTVADRTDAAVPALQQKALSPRVEEPTEPPAQKTQPSHSGKTYPVVETHLSSGDTSYENIEIENATPYEPDYGALIASSLPFEFKDNRTVQVLIYHTHTCESYLDDDSGVYDEDFYPRSTDGSQGVIAVGEALAAALKEQGIGVVHDTTLHDYPSYEGSYGRSWDTVAAYAERYPGIVVTLDIHRDSMTASDGTKYKPTFTYDGEKAAQIMIMTGYDEDGGFPTWEENLIFATKLQKECEDQYPGMTRPMYFGEFSYNMDFNNGSLLIEVGTDANSVDEAKRTGELLGKALSSVLQKG